MGCGANTKDNNSEADDAINNYSERDNFYSFHIKRRNNNEPSSNHNNYKNKKNKNQDDNNNNEEQSKEDNNNTSNKNNEDKNEQNSGDLVRQNSNEESNGEQSNKKNGSNNNGNVTNSNDDDNHNKSKTKKNKINDTNPFKESSNEIEYYSKELKAKGKGKEKDEAYNKLIYDYKNMFSDNGEKIPEYKVYANLNNNKEKSKNIKRDEINGVVIVEDLKEYFPKDITREEIQELVFEAFGDSVVEDEDLIIPGQTASYDQVLELSDYIFNYIKGNDKKIKQNKSLERLNVKIDLVPLDKNLIKDKLFKGKEPTEKQIDNALKAYEGNSKDVKILSIEFL